MSIVLILKKYDVSAADSTSIFGQNVKYHPSEYEYEYENTGGFLNVVLG
jgi:hypothetical protein